MSTTSCLLSQEQQLLIEEQLDIITSLTVGATILHATFILLNLGGLLANLVVFLCTLRSKTIRSSNSGIVTGNVAFLDACRASITIITSIYFLTTGRVGGGADGCYLSALLIVPMCGISLYSMVIIAMDRYLAIVRSYQMSKKMALGLIFAGTGLSVLITLLPAIFHHESYYGIKSSGLICTLRPSDRSQAGIIVTVCSYIYLLVPSSVIFNCYLAILKTVIAAASATRRYGLNKVKTTEKMTLSDVYKFIRDMDQHDDTNSVQIRSDVETTMQSKQTTELSTATSSKPRKATNKQELLVFRKSLVLFLAYNACWGPYLIYLIYETATGTLAPPWFDGISLFCSVFFMYVNATLNILLDERYKREFSSLFFQLK